MRKRIVMVGLLVVLVLLLPSCPGTPSPLVGVWTLVLGSDTIGLELNADGSASSFPSPDTLDGVLSWEINGTEFILRRVKENPMGPSVSVLYVGRLVNDSSIYGAWIHWEGGPYGSSGLFSAEKQ